MNRVSHDLNQTELFSSWDSAFNALEGPLGGQLISESTSETTEVGDAGTREEDITDQLVDLVLQDCNSFSPTDTFVFEKDDELFGSHHATLVSLHLRLEFSLLILEGLSLCLLGFDLSDSGGDTSELFVQDCLCFVSNLCDLVAFLLLRHNLLVDDLKT